VITVHYTDGSTARFNNRAEAEEGISETVIGCDFAVGVESIESDDDLDYSCNYSIKLEANE